MVQLAHHRVEKAGIFGFALLFAVIVVGSAAYVLSEYTAMQSAVSDDDHSRVELDTNANARNKYEIAQGWHTTIALVVVAALGVITVFAGGLVWLWLPAAENVAEGQESWRRTGKYLFMVSCAAIFAGTVTAIVERSSFVDDVKSLRAANPARQTRIQSLYDTVLAMGVVATVFGLWVILQDGFNPPGAEYLKTALHDT